MNNSGNPISQASLLDLMALAQLEKRCFSEDDIFPITELAEVLVGHVRLKLTLDGKFVGFLAGERVPSECCGWIVSLAIDPDYQHQGWGARLLQAGEKALAMPRVRLTVRASNFEAILLYQKSGYVFVGRDPGYYVGGEDGLIYEKRFS